VLTAFAVEAVPVSSPTNVVAVIIPAAALIPDVFIVTPEPTTTLIAVAIPNDGVVNIGDVRVLLVNVSVEDIVTIFTPSIATTPADTLVIVVSVACPNSIEPTPKPIVVDEVIPVIGSPVQLVRIPELGVPNTGVIRVGLVANTAAPVPVSSVNAVKSCSDVKEPNNVVVLTDVIAPVKFGILVVVVAVPVNAPTNDVAVITPVTFTPPAPVIA